MLLLFATAIFVSAALLFLVQPMVARMVLPLLGGTPAVWNTCMVFFQAVLLVGYAYAHALTRVRRPAVQVMVHAAVCAVPLLLLPVGLQEGAAPPGDGSPIPWLIAALAVAVGAPFFVLSTTGPLVQRWFSITDHPAARDPYFLYAASNAGSLLSLLAYPFLLEPLMTLKDQGRAWSAGYVLLAVLLITAGILSVRRRRVDQQDAAPAVSTNPDTPAATPVTWKSRVLWVLLAFAPSSLMLGATSFISTDLASVPLLWIMPLTVYLLTMIVAYSRPGPRATTIARIATPIIALTVAVTMLMQLKGPISVLIGVHMLLLLTGAMACHGRLAALRPSPERLTEYFLLISLGGVLGGSFNALLAPAIFNAVYEYLIAIALTCWLGMTLTVPGRPPRPWWRPEVLALDVILPVAVIAALFGSWRVAMKLDREYDLSFALQSLVSFTLPVVGCLVLALWPRRFAAAVGLIMLVAITSFGGTGRVKLAERSFFGVHRVVDTPDGRARKLLHGSTNHGMQLLDPASRPLPLTYYAPTGPAGRVFEALGGAFRLSEVALVGLGAGTLAAYARPGQQFTFLEIDPVVARVAADPNLFTYLSSCAGKTTTILGDGRLALQRDGDARYDLIVLDAFSSDAIPVHLLTVEAFEVYLSRLSERGLLLLHLTNRHLELPPVISGVCQRLGLIARVDHDVPTPQEAATLKAESTWALVARSEADLGALALDPRWRAIEGRPILWTDDFSNIIDVLKR